MCVSVIVYLILSQCVGGSKEKQDQMAFMITITELLGSFKQAFHILYFKLVTQHTLITIVNKYTHIATGMKPVKPHMHLYSQNIIVTPQPQLIQFRLLCLMYHQYHQFKCIPLEPPGGTSFYSTRTPAYFANTPMFRLSFPQFFSVLKQHNGGIHYHPL